MGLASWNYYYYDKYELLAEWETETEETTEVVDTTTVYKDSQEEISVDRQEISLGGPSASQWFPNPDQIVLYRNLDGYRDYRYMDAQDLEYEKTLAYERDINESVYLSTGQIWYKYEYGDLNTTILKAEIAGFWFDRVMGSTAIALKPLAEVNLVKKTYTETETNTETDEILLSAKAGKLVESDILLTGVYPKNGSPSFSTDYSTYSQDDYWYIRKELYTIPPPLLISPENAIQREIENDFTGLTFQFELQRRLIPSEGLGNITPLTSDNAAEDDNLYHVKVRLGTNSDFIDYKYKAESKEDPSNFKYYDGSSWVAFPAEGIPSQINDENTQVMFTPPDSWTIDKGGSYYWGASAFNSQWGYSPSDFRLIIFMGKLDGPYTLNIGGRTYNALELNIEEATNGTVGKMNIKLSNHNFKK